MSEKLAQREYVCVCAVVNWSRRRTDMEKRILDRITSTRGVVIECATPEEKVQAIDEALARCGNPPPIPVVTTECPRCLGERYKNKRLEEA